MHIGMLIKASQKCTCIPGAVCTSTPAFFEGLGPRLLVLLIEFPKNVQPLWRLCSVVAVSHLLLWWEELERVDSRWGGRSHTLYSHTHTHTLPLKPLPSFLLPQWCRVYDQKFVEANIMSPIQRYNHQLEQIMWFSSCYIDHHSLHQGAQSACCILKLQWKGRGCI